MSNVPQPIVNPGGPVEQATTLQAVSVLLAEMQARVSQLTATVSVLANAGVQHAGAINTIVHRLNAAGIPAIQVVANPASTPNPAPLPAGPAPSLAPAPSPAPAAAPTAAVPSPVVPAPAPAAPAAPAASPAPAAPDKAALVKSINALLQQYVARNGMEQGIAFIQRESGTAVRRVVDLPIEIMPKVLTALQAAMSVG